MPEYTFRCSACTHTFSIITTMVEYNDTQKCPVCKHIKSVHRDYVSDLSTINTNVKLGDDDLKLGHLAKRNSERLSNDEKAKITEKNNAYKNEESTKELPKGMSRMGRTKETRKVPTKQRRRDPKRKAK